MNKTQLRQLIREHIKEVFDPAKDKVFMELMAWINPKNSIVTGKQKRSDGY